MQVTLRQLYGNWDLGFALDKHLISSEFIGTDEYGHDRFKNVRTEAGEATYQLKYKQDWGQASVLAQAVAEHILPRLGGVSVTIPMAASTWRARQPVTEVTNELAKLIGVPSIDGLLLKAKGGTSLKDLKTKEQKVSALAQAGFSVANSDVITNNGKWDALLLDDLYHTGASIEAAVAALRTHPKLNRIYVAALTHRG
jgi:predicted amidophosphoribosyltransferase